MNNLTAIIHHHSHSHNHSLTNLQVLDEVIELTGSIIVHRLDVRCKTSSLHNVCKDVQSGDQKTYGGLGTDLEQLDSWEALH
jgi:hypothetical protein